MILSIDKRKHLTKYSLIKTHKKVGIEGSYLEIIKAVYERPNTNIILNGGKLRAFPLRSGTWQDVHSRHCYSYCIGNLSLSNQTTQRNKGIQISKEEVKLSLLADDMMLYMENPKDYTKKLLELIHEFSKVTGYKINVQKSVTFLYANNEAAERKIKELIPFTIALKTTKYLLIN